MRKLFLLLIIIPLISSCDADVINKLTGYRGKKKETVEEKKKKAKNMLDEVSGMLMIDTSNELIKDEFEEIEPKDVEEIVIDSLYTEPYDIFEDDEDIEEIIIKERNILNILVNGYGEILANYQLTDIYDLNDIIVEFIDNGGGTNGKDWVEITDAISEDGESVITATKNNYGNKCSYCNGMRYPNSSENPGKAIINYSFNDSLDNEIAQELLTIIDDAYTELRNRYAYKMFGISYSKMMEDYYDPYWKGNRSALKNDIYFLRSLYPKQISENLARAELTPPPPPPPPEIIEIIEDEEEIEETIIESTEFDEELIIEDIEIEDVEEEVEVPFAVIENVPVFPGCERGNNEQKRRCMSEKIARFVQKNFNTKLAGDLGLTGRQRISIIFKIDKSGNVTGVRARAPHPRLEEEAQRVINLLPKMQPGKQRGKAVIVPYSLPLIFQVQD